MNSPKKKLVKQSSRLYSIKQLDENATLSLISSIDSLDNSFNIWDNADIRTKGIIDSDFHDITGKKL